MRIAFAIENQLGHRALLANLKEALRENPDIDPLWLRLEPEGAGLLQRIPRVRNLHALTFGLQARKLFDAARRLGKLDACFLHTQRGAHLAVDHMKRVPTFISIDATPGLLESYRSSYGLKSQRGTVYWNVRDAIHRRTYGAARGMITMSAVVASTLSSVYQVDPADVLVLLPGVDTVKKWCPPATRAPNEECRLLFVGGDFERKGGKHLLRWAKETQQRHFHVDIVTSEPLEPTPHVTVHVGLGPNDPALIRVVQQADLMVLPTLADVSSWVIAEAKATGTAVLSTRVGGIPELVREGVDGWLVPPNEYETFARCLDDAIADRQRLADFGLRAREDAMLRFDARANARRLLEFMGERLS